MSPRPALAALVLANLAACGGESPASFGQGAVVQVMPAFAEVMPLDVLPVSAFVTGVVDTGVTWEVAESGGGTIDAEGLYTAPQGTGVFHVVARSKAAPSASATAEVSITPTPQYRTGKAIGANLSWWTYWDSQALADTARQGDYRAADGSLLTRTDAQGWPAQDFVVYVGAHTAGAYTIRFNGRATLDPAVVLTYDAATNTSTGTHVVARAPGYLGFTFRNTQRVDGGPTNAGVTNLKIMRPGRALDVGTPATRFDPDYAAAVQTFQWFRAMTTFGTSAGVAGNSDAHWSDADAVAAGVPAYAAGATYRFGDQVVANGKVYLATFAHGTMSGAAGSSPPNHHQKGAYSSGPVVADGSVYWRRAARVLPRGNAGPASGPAWEDLILLANRTRTAPWFSIPYFATDLYVTKLARLLKYGSDANGEPYTSPQASPVHPPLEPALPFIVEWSNEIWNGIAPYPASYHEAFAEAEYASTNPWRLASTNRYARGAQRAMALTARMSVLFRQVFGDADMMTRVRPVFAWQLANSGNCGAALAYLSSVWNDPARTTVNGYAAHHPVDWYVYGIASAPYDAWARQWYAVSASGTPWAVNDVVYMPGGASTWTCIKENRDLNPTTSPDAWRPATVDDLFAQWSRELTVLKGRLDAYDQLAAQYGIRTLTYEGGNEKSSSLITQAQADARYASALMDLTHAFWNTPRGTADVYMHYLMDSSSNNMTLGIPAAAPYGNGDQVAAYLKTIVTRDTPGWTAMRALRAETGR